MFDFVNYELNVKLAEQARVFHWQNQGHITTENDFPQCK